MLRREIEMDENKAYHDIQDIYDTCKKHMHAYVLIETTDGFSTDGIITGLDDDNLYLAVPIEPGQESGQQIAPNQFGGGYPGYGYGGGYGPGYGYGGGYGPGYGYGFRPRRFRRLIIPLAVLATLSLLPWY